MSKNDGTRKDQEVFKIKPFKNNTILFFIISYLFLYTFIFIENWIMIAIYGSSGYLQFTIQYGPMYLALFIIVLSLSLMLHKLLSSHILIFIYSAMLIINSIVTFMIKKSGIIDITWITLMCVTYIGTYYLINFTLPSFSNDILNSTSITNNSDRIEFIKLLHHDLAWYFTKGLQGLLSLGAITGVAMSILFRPGYVDFEVKASAGRMVYGFLSISVTASVFIFLPFSRLLRHCRLALKSVEIDDGN